MIAALKAHYHWSAITIGLFSFLSMSAASFAAEQAVATDVTVISCPPEIQDLRLNYTTKYLPPKGWGHADAMVAKTKGGALNSVKFTLNSHQVQARDLICSYGLSSGNRKVNLASIKKVIPKGASCTAEPEYSFQCSGMGQ